MAKLSDKRREMAEKIEAGQVHYDLPRWIVEGTEVGGWQGRMLREMRRDGLLVVDEAGVVALSDRTRAMLSGD